MTAWTSTRARRGLRAVGACVASLCVASAAVASPGDHIRAGDMVITPQIGAGLEYRTNVYRAESDAEGGPNLRVVPQLELALDGSDATFELSGQYEIRKYFAPDQVSLDRFDNFDVGAKISVLDQQPVGLKLSDDAALRNQPVESFTSEDPFSTQLSNDLEGVVELRPGTALAFGLGGSWRFDDYRVPSGAQLTGTRAFNRKNTYGPVFHGRWDFFPRTALALDASYKFIRWQDNLISTADASGQLGDFLASPDATTFVARAGIRGRIAVPLVVVLMVGYGDARYDEDSVAADADAATAGTELDAATFAADLSGVDHLLLDAQLKYTFGLGQEATVGYNRSFQDVYFTNYLAYDYVFARLNNRFGNRVGTALEFGARFEGYTGEITRQDIRLLGKGDVAVAASDWAKISTGVSWTQRASTDDLVEYDDVNIHLIGTFTY